MDTLTIYLGQNIDSSFFITVLISFLGGILTSFTPCIYPLIPITVAVVGGNSVASRSRMVAVVLTVSYVMGLCSVYTLLGITAAYTGMLFGSIAASPWANLVVGNVILLMGLYMLDVFAMPAMFNWNIKVKGNVISVFVVGAVSGLVMAPCTTPPLAALLTYVGSRGNMLLGGTAMFAYSLGMSTLLIVIGIFSGMLSVLPKSGAWLVWVKRAMGFAMIAMGEYFVFQAGVFF